MNPPEPLRPGLVLTLPIAAGRVEAWRRFCQELSGSRRPEFEASRQRLGITRERMVLVESLFGASAVTTLEAHNLALALAEMLASKRPFESWYRERLQDLCGITLTHYEHYVQGGLADASQETLFEWILPGRPGPEQGFLRQRLADDEQA